MKILVVGNIFKDVYLNIDERTEKLETDTNGVKWLDLSFDASEHRFFRRVGSFGGAVISLEVLSKMGLEVSLSGSNIGFDEDGIITNGEIQADIHRYILIYDGETSFLAPSFERVSTFVAPEEPVDCIFVDRSANLKDVKPILKYLEENPQTKLVVHARKNARGVVEKELAPRAAIVFAESEQIKNVDPKHLILIKKNRVSFGEISQEFDLPRENLMTHLSIYTILAATILGGIMTKRSIKESFRLARANVENSSLDATLSLEHLEELAA